MSKLIQEEIDGDSLEVFIRNFVNIVIVSKINDNKYNIKLDILFNILGDEKPKIKGERHIDDVTVDNILYLENQTCVTIEVKKTIDNPNRFTYNVYTESL